MGLVLVSPARLKCLKQIFFLTLIILFCISCSSGKGGGNNYILTSVFPASVHPSEIVTLYGTFPKEVTLKLVGENVSVTPLSTNALQFIVPEKTIAGDHSLLILGKDITLEGKLQVLPRIDKVILENLRIKITGAGWPLLQDILFTANVVNTASTTSKTDANETKESDLVVSNTQIKITLNNHLLTPILNEKTLEAELPTEIGYGLYGDLQVKVTVDNLASDLYTLQREASIAQGKVNFPAEIPVTFLEQKISNLNFNISSSSTDKTALIVHFKDNINNLSFLCDLEGIQECNFLSPLNATRLGFKQEGKAQKAFEELSKADFVQYLEWDALVKTDGFESYPFTLVQNSRLVEDQWHLPLLGIEQAWQVTEGKGVVVGVLDTGVNLEHPDLKENLLTGYDFVDNDNLPNDLEGHGTHVAGLVAANGKIKGTAPQVSLLPVRVLLDSSGGSSFTVAQGILWAAGLLGQPPNPTPAQVINLSLGTSSFSSTLADAVQKAIDAGVIVVAAAGNSGGPLAYPAALPNVIAVTALAGPKIAYQPFYANRGEGIYLTAFGGDISQDQDNNGVLDGILSTDLNSSDNNSDAYSLRAGTSMASPQVAGLAALALAIDTPPKLVKESLGHTATELGVIGYDSNFGFGLAMGRVVTISSPRVYVIAFDEQDRLITWTLVQKDASFTLGNIPTNTSLTLLAASDENANGKLAEAGELLSQRLTFTGIEGETINIDNLNLSISEGQSIIPLE